MPSQADEGGGAATAILVALAIILIVLIVNHARKPGRVAPPRVEPGGAPFSGASPGGVPAGGDARGGHADSRTPPFAAGTEPPLLLGEASPSGMAYGGSESQSPERRSVYAALNRLYSTADVDPLITGQLYDYSDGVRNVYAERTSHGDLWGLTEYSSSGGAGDVGVDVGPYGEYEYGGRQAAFDDGIPENYGFPSTPVRWYAPRQRDYYGPEGPTVYSEGLYPLWEPDHSPLMN